jgi:predicted neutral ceramidase superfamily lipid hydrolase
MRTFAFLLVLCPILLRAEFRAAISVRVVTPEPLLPVSGGMGPSHPVNKKEGDLTVRALVFADEQTRVAIVSADFLGFPSVLGNKVRAKVNGIPAENILIGATHTHSAPDCYGFPDGKGGFASDLKYLDSVCDRMAEAINDAVGKLQPARLKISTGEAKGKIAFNY